MCRKGGFIQCDDHKKSPSFEALLMEDGLVSCVRQDTRALLSTDAASSVESSTTKHGTDLPLAFSSMVLAGSSGRDSALDGDQQDSLSNLLENLRSSCRSNSHASKLLELSLFNKLHHGHSSKTAAASRNVFITEGQGKALLEHAVTSLSPASVKTAGLLMARSKLLLEHFTSYCIPKLCNLPLCDLELCCLEEGNVEVLKVHSYFYLFAQFFQALSALDSSGKYFF